jgi:beta-lactamase regulating signal transducer with metallopeptidase domain
VGTDGSVAVEEKPDSEASPAVVVSQVADTVERVSDTVESVSEIVTQASNLASLPMRFLRAARSVIAGCLLVLVLLVVAGFLVIFFLVRR